MKLFEKVTEDNFLMYAARCYYNPRCIDPEEFYEDLNRFKYVKKLLNRYKLSGQLSERLILNHLTVIFNAFGMPSGVKMLEHKVGLEDWSIVKPFLIYLKAIENHQYAGVELDHTVVEALRKI